MLMKRLVLPDLNLCDDSSNSEASWNRSLSNPQTPLLHDLCLNKSNRKQH